MTSEPVWRASRWKRAQVALIPALVYPLTALLGRTWRWRVEGREHLDALERANQPHIIAFWHGRILPGTVYFRRRGIVVITSENFDGEWIARVIARFGYGTARGSSSRGAIKALVQLRRDLAAGRSVAFTLDGPRGPARVAQPGAVWLASATGNAIVPFHAEASRHWTVRSWDRTQVPRPFATVGLCIGEPFRVEAGADEAAIERARLRLHEVLATLEERARALAAGPGRE